MSTSSVNDIGDDMVASSDLIANVEKIVNPYNPLSHKITPLEEAHTTH